MKLFEDIVCGAVIGLMLIATVLGSWTLCFAVAGAVGAAGLVIAYRGWMIKLHKLIKRIK